jgi:hypothetical protein
MRWCSRITRAGLAHLTGIHTLHMSSLAVITNASLALLRAHKVSVAFPFLRG